MKLRLILIAILVFGFVAKVMAAIEVEPIIADTLSQAQVTGKSSKTLDITVINLDKKHNGYVSVTPLKVVNPGTPEEKEESVSNVKKLGLYISPSKLVISPGGRKLVRVGFLRPAAVSDNIFRVVFSPNVRLEAKYAPKNSAGIKVLVSYGALVIQRPAKLAPKLDIQRKGQRLTIKNLGNTSIELYDFKQCDKKNKCEKLPDAKRMYPGNNWTVMLPKDAPVTFEQLLGLESKHVLIK